MYGQPVMSSLIVNATGVLTLVKASAGDLFGLSFGNGTAVLSYIQFFNASSTGAVTLGTTNPILAYAVPASGALNIPPGTFSMGHFSAGIVYAATSAIKNSTTEAQSGTIWYL